jgi:DNA-nicking Smr family endonuclease
LWRRVAATLKPRRLDAARAKQAQAVAPAPILKSERNAPTPSPMPIKRDIKSPPLPERGGEKRVRRGKLEIAATLDLHGHTQDSAPRALVGFLRAAHKRGARAVVVVTGAGRGGEGVLKRRLPEWLARGEIRPLTAGFAPAHRNHGGNGAFYVFLKQSR